MDSLKPPPPHARSLNEAKVFFISDRQEYIIFFTRTRLWCYTKVAKFLGHFLRTSMHWRWRSLEPVAISWAEPHRRVRHGVEEPCILVRPPFHEAQELRDFGITP